MAELEIRAILRDEFSAQAQKIISELRQIGAEGTTAGGSLRSGMSSALPTVQSVTDSLGAQNAQLRAQIAAYKDPAGAAYLQEQKRLKAEIDDLTGAGQKQTTAWTDLVSKYYMASQALGMVKTATMAVVDASSRYDSISVRLQAFEGGAEGAARAFDKLQSLAKQPGLGLEQAANAYAALRGLKQDGPDAVKIIEAIAHANATMGGGAEEFGRAMNQIQQMLGKGKLMAEDINTISESIPNFRALVLEAFGTMDTKVLNSKYSIEQLLAGIEGAAEKLPKPGETIKNNLDNIGDAWTRLMASFGNTQMIKSATGALASIIEKLAIFNENGSKAASVMKEMGLSDIEVGRYLPSGVTGATSGSASGASYAAYMAASASPAKPAALTPEQIEARRKAAAEQLAKDEKAAADRVAAFNLSHERENEQNQADTARQIGMARRGGPGVGIQWSEKTMTEDRAADEKYYKDREKRAKDAEEKRIAQAEKMQEDNDRMIEKWRKDQLAKQERYEKAKTAVASRFAEGSVGAAMKAFGPLDRMFERMMSRNDEMTESWTKNFQAIGLEWTAMLTQMVEEYIARAAIFGTLSLIPGFGGASGFLGGAASFIFGGRASGGAMFPGVAYAYNERQPGGGEIFRPSTAGTASPNLSGGGGGGSITINLHGGATAADANRVARAIEQQNRGRLRTVTRRG